MEAARDRFQEAETLKAGGELEQAAAKYMQLVNDMTKRLVLGVETYVDFLDAVYNLPKVVEGGTPSLSEEEACGMQRLVTRSFVCLAEIYDHMGEDVQAQRYRKFMQKAGMTAK